MRRDCGFKEKGNRADFRLHAVFYGRVQGVSFRSFVSIHAARLLLTGWVKNQPDGSVELVAEGPKESLDALLGACRVGPALARVDSVIEDWGAAQGVFSGFEILVR